MGCFRATTDELYRGRRPGPAGLDGWVELTGIAHWHQGFSSSLLCFAGGEPPPCYSYRTASIGSFRAALTAGATPKMIPTLMQTLVARAIAFVVIRGRSGE